MKREQRLVRQECGWHLEEQQKASVLGGVSKEGRRKGEVREQPWAMGMELTLRQIGTYEQWCDMT